MFAPQPRHSQVATSGPPAPDSSVANAVPFVAAPAEVGGECRWLYQFAAVCLVLPLSAMAFFHYWLNFTYVCFPQPRLLQVAVTGPPAADSTVATAATAVAAATEVGDECRWWY